MGRTIRTKEYGVIIAKLRQARHDAGLTQVEVAKSSKGLNRTFLRLKQVSRELISLNLKKFAELYKKGSSDNSVGNPRFQG